MIARIFPRRTRATPTDELAYTRMPNLFDYNAGITEVQVSVTFTDDLPRAERLAQAWGSIAPTSIGGPATGAAGGDFTPGKYLKQGYVITSRGCPNRCWFCSVPSREGGLRELPITEGYNVLDDNLLACSEDHIRSVFAMLKIQPRRAQFTGGLEAAILKPWHVDLLADLKPDQMFFAYDTPNDYEPLIEAGKLLQAAGFTVASHTMRCYVLVGDPRDSFDAAEQRLTDTIRAGFMPLAMLYYDRRIARDREWIRFTRAWANEYIVGAKMRQVLEKR